MVALDLPDDVEDGESNPVIEMYGLPATVNASTGLIYLAQHMLLSLDDGCALATILARSALRAMSGQHADLTLTAGPVREPCGTSSCERGRTTDHLVPSILRARD